MKVVHQQKSCVRKRRAPWSNVELKLHGMKPGLSHIVCGSLDRNPLFPMFRPYDRPFSPVHNLCLKCHIRQIRWNPTMAVRQNRRNRIRNTTETDLQTSFSARVRPSADLRTVRQSIYSSARAPPCLSRQLIIASLPVVISMDSSALLCFENCRCWTTSCSFIPKTCRMD